MEREKKSNKDIFSTAILGKELDIRRRLHIGILLYLGIETAILVLIFILDISKFFVKFRDYLFKRNPDFFECLVKIKSILWENQEDVLNVVLTLGTILAAAVIFFYSVQDNKKGGIPNRAIMSYTSGSFSVPILFLTIMFMIPLNHFTFIFGLRYFSWTETIFTYISQMIIIVIILESTSHSYSIHAICNAEIRQYRKLIKLNTENEEQNFENSQHTNQISPLLWTYLLEHMEQALLSDELITDKLEIARRLLRVPYYEKETYILQELFWLLREHKKNKTNTANGYPKISANKLKNNLPDSLYEFYYRNLITVFQRIKQQDYREERHKLYLILYGFMEELTDLYDNVCKDRYQDINSCHSHYTITLCGILNAVMDSNVQESAEFCHYVFNNIVSKDVWQMQICLYFIFQEYLYRTNEEAVKLDSLENINALETWQFRNLSEQEKEKCWQFWWIWTKHTTLSEKSQRKYLIQTFVTWEKEWHHSVPIMYIKQELHRIRGNKI